MNNESPYRESPEQPRLPTWWQANWKFVVEWSVKLMLGLVLNSSVKTCLAKDEQNRVEHQKQESARLNEMKALCAPDHYKLRMKAAEGLWQVECMSASTGVTRLVYVKAPTP